MTPTYDVYEMYTVHHDAVMLPLTLDAGTYILKLDVIPQPRRGCRDLLDRHGGSPGAEVV